MDGYTEAGYADSKFLVAVVEDSEGNPALVLQHSTVLSMLCGWVGRLPLSSLVVPLGIWPFSVWRRWRLDNAVTTAKFYLSARQAAENMRGPGASKIPAMSRALLADLFPGYRSAMHFDAFQSLNQAKLSEELAHYLVRYVWGYIDIVDRIVYRIVMQQHLSSFITELQVELANTSQFLVDDQQSQETAIAVLKEQRRVRGL